MKNKNTSRKQAQIKNADQVKMASLIEKTFPAKHDAPSDKIPLTEVTGKAACSVDSQDQERSSAHPSTEHVDPPGSIIEFEIGFVLFIGCPAMELARWKLVEERIAKNILRQVRDELGESGIHCHGIEVNPNVGVAFEEEPGVGMFYLELRLKMTTLSLQYVLPFQLTTELLGGLGALDLRSTSWIDWPAGEALELTTLHVLPLYFEQPSKFSRACVYLKDWVKKLPTYS